MVKLREYKPFVLSYNDVLLVPQYNEVKSRADVDLSTKLTRNITIKHPIIATNMSTVCEYDMAVEMFRLGSVGLIHRFMSLDKMCEIIDKLTEFGVFPICISIGIQEQDYHWVDTLMKRENKPHIIFCDVAHADNPSMIKIGKYIKTNYDVDLIIGNIVTSEACERVIKGTNCDAIRCGIGGGSCCTTRTTTGFGQGNVTAIMECAKIASYNEIPLIGDGGINCGGDIAKAIYFGASTVSLGRLLASTSASPGEIIIENGEKKKKMYGMASKEGREAGGKSNNGIAAEGITRFFDYTGDTQDIVHELLASLRSSCTYGGAFNLEDFRKNTEYVILSPGGMVESKFI